MIILNYVPMKIRFFSLITILFLCITSCYDDADLRNQLAELDLRITSLETLCNQMNTNISSLQTIVEALQKNEYVESLVPIKEGNKVIGYTVTFSKSGDITIYSSKEAVDAMLPAIGVKQDNDGLLYWSIDGEWLLDDMGNKVQASANDGITPELKVQDGYWWVSYDSGKSWNKLDYKVDETIVAGNPIFMDVKEDDETVTFTLYNGTSFVINKLLDLEVVFENTENILIAQGELLIIPFTVIGMTEGLKVECIAEQLYSEVAMTSDDKGELRVKGKSFSEDFKAKVILLVSNDRGQVVMKALTFEEKHLTGIQDVYDVPIEGGTVEVGVYSNMEYEVIIPEEAQSWITYVQTRAVKLDALEFYVSSSGDVLDRSAEIEVKSIDGTMSYAFTIIQRHSHASIFGNYTVRGKSYFEGTITWEVEFTYDSVDKNKVWMRGLSPYFMDSNDLIYGIISDDHNTITIPTGQSFPYNSTYNVCFYAVANEYFYNDSTVPSITLTRNYENEPFVSADYGWCYYAVYVSSGEGNGFFDVIVEGATFTKN